MKTAKLSVLPIKDLNPAEYNPRKKLKPGTRSMKRLSIPLKNLDLLTL